MVPAYDLQQSEARSAGVESIKVDLLAALSHERCSRGGESGPCAGRPRGVGSASGYHFANCSEREFDDIAEIYDVFFAKLLDSSYASSSCSVTVLDMG